MPSNGGGEVGVQRRCQAVMQVIYRSTLSAPKVQGLRHTPRCQDADELVEVRVIFPQCCIQRCSQGLHIQTKVYTCACSER